jgi:transposase
MKRVEAFIRGRRAVLIDGMSRRAAARHFGISRKTVDKMPVLPELPGGAWPARPTQRKLAEYTEIIDQILVDDARCTATATHCRPHFRAFAR